jgi:hypothetical protein
MVEKSRSELHDSSVYGNDACSAPTPAQIRGIDQLKTLPKAAREEHEQQTITALPLNGLISLA